MPDRDWREAYHRGFVEGCNRSFDQLRELHHQAINQIPQVVQITLSEGEAKSVVAQLELAQRVRELEQEAAKRNDQS